MLSDKYGNPLFQDQDILSLLYQGKLECLDSIFAVPSEEIRQLTEHTGLKIKISNQELSMEEVDYNNQQTWLIPEEYTNMDIEEYLVTVCPKENYQRLIEELQAFRERNMLPVLRVLKYITDTLRKNNVIWGVGRGSSVSSYALYLLGIHKINPIKYNLDWREFLR